MLTSQALQPSVGHVLPFARVGESTSPWTGKCSCGCRVGSEGKWGNGQKWWASRRNLRELRFPVALARVVKTLPNPRPDLLGLCAIAIPATNPNTIGGTRHMRIALLVTQKFSVGYFAATVKTSPGRSRASPSTAGHYATPDSILIVHAVLLPVVMLQPDECSCLSRSSLWPQEHSAPSSCR